MVRRILCAVAGLALIGCGDNKRQCGTGTEEVAGVCVPGGGAPPTCGAGTHLNAMTDACEVDMTACQDGTVLIHGACVDPTAGLTIDVEEGVEPDGFGIGGEPSATPAGLVTLKPVGAPGPVLHGHLTARPDRDEDGQLEPDYDTYLVDVTGATLLKITADGVHGVDAGFVAVTYSPQVEDWTRYGVNLTGDTAQRELYLPAAGRYAIAIADSRSLVLGSAVGDATSEYYVTLDQLALPAPTPITAGTTTGTLAPGEAKFFTATLGTGLNELSLAVDAPTVTPSLVFGVTALVIRTADARMIVGGMNPTDDRLIVVDQKINTAAATAGFALTLVKRDATALLTGTVGGPATAVNLSVAPTSLDDLAEFSFNGGSVTGLDLRWDRPVDGVVLDDRGEVAAPFSWDPRLGTSFGLFAGFGSATWDHYRGAFRAARGGRYYLAVYDPSGAVGDVLKVTGTFRNLPQQTLDDTAFFDFDSSTFGAAAVRYPTGALPWVDVTLSADPAAGATMQLYDDATTTGRLGPLVLTDQFGGGTFTDPGDGIPLMDITALVGSQASAARILLGGPQQLLGIVTPAASPSEIFVQVGTQVFIDEGTHQGGSVITHPGVTFHPVTHRTLHLVRTDASNIVTVTVHPTTPGLDVQIDSLAADETVRAFANDQGAGGDETLEVVADARGYVAIAVEALAGTDPYDITIGIASPFYTPHAGTTPWANACIGGTEITPLDRDDGVTTTIPVPAGFDFYGTQPAAMVVSTNGWLSFDTSTPVGGPDSRTAQQLPNGVAPNAVVAAYWDDLDQVRICTKTIGTKTVVQWRGVRFDDTSVTVAAQAILDGANDTIELVYAPYSAGTGASATAGVEDSSGHRGTAVVPGTATKLTHP